MAGLSSLMADAPPAPPSAPGEAEGDADGDDEGYADAGDALKDALSAGDGLAIAKAVEALVALSTAKM